MIASAYEIVARAPTPEEYRALCAAVGWEPFFAPDHVGTALRNSLHHAVALHDGEVVGMGRVVGDGAVHFYVNDVAVAPAHQGQGLGTRIIEHLLGRVLATAPRPAHVYLFSASGAEAFYERFGFARSPNGMHLGLYD